MSPKQRPTEDWYRLATNSDEGHGFSRAVKHRANDGFSRGDTLFMSPKQRSTEDWYRPATNSDEGHGFSRAVKHRANDGFSR
jgi:hypothetical protein